MTPDKPAAIVAHLMTSVSRGGLELYVRELIVKLHGSGVQQVVVCDQQAFMIPELKSLGIAVEFIPRGSRYSLARMLLLRKIDKQYGVGLWHSHQRDDMILVALAFFFRGARMPAGRREHGGFQGGGSKVSKSQRQRGTAFRHIFSLYMGFARKKDLLHRLVYRRIERLVTTSELMNSLALQRLPVSERQVQCIRYGRDEKAFAVQAAKVRAVRRELGLKASQRLVVSLCRLDPMKGVREFVEAARLVDNRVRGKFRFVQIGERTIIGFDDEKRPIYLPESEDCYRQLVAAERGAQGTSRFKLLPFQKDYQPYLLAADYFVLGSYDEMYSLSVIDAMMAGALVIGTNNGGTVEQLAGQGSERGILIESKSAIAIADALLRTEKNPALKTRLQKAAQAWVLKEHTWKAVLPQWLALYRG
ncbi:MAG: glycosyltransferase family 4 protein [Turneriella sp.]